MTAGPELWLSSLAIVISLTALIWQVVAWRKQGPQPSVHAYLVRTSALPAVLTVEIRNVGRVPFQVMNIALIDRKAHSGIMLRGYALPEPKLPIRVEPHSNVLVYHNAAALAAAISAHRPGAWAALIEVALGDGRLIHSKGTIRLPIAELAKLYDVEITHTPTPERVISSTETERWWWRLRRRLT